MDPAEAGQVLRSVAPFTLSTAGAHHSDLRSANRIFDFVSRNYKIEENPQESRCEWLLHHT